MSERVAVVGSRAHPNLYMVREYVRSLPRDTVIVSGGAKGVDTTAEEEAISLGMEGLIFTPGDVLLHAPRALRALPPRDLLIARNTLIAVACTRMVVFPDGSRGGSFDSVAQAKRFRRPCEIRWADGRVEVAK